MDIFFITGAVLFFPLLMVIIFFCSRFLNLCKDTKANREILIDIYGELLAIKKLTKLNRNDKPQSHAS